MLKPRALLVGIPHYDDPNIDDLDFVVGDLKELHTSLTRGGYDVDVHDHTQTDRDRIENAVEQFCRQAESGQRLLILLSGHGIHRNGIDYILPSSADTRSKKLTDRCVPIDFKEYVEASFCGDVTVAVDACREGVHLQEKGSYSVGWSNWEREAASGRTITYIYACSEGEWARYVKSDIESYSIFSRALSLVATDESGPSLLIAAVKRMQQHAEEITAREGLPQQKIQPYGDLLRAQDVVLFQRKDASTDGSISVEHAWAEWARGHPAWELADECEPVKEATVRMIDLWAREFDAHTVILSADRWMDVNLARRFADRLCWLFQRVLNQEKLARSQDSLPLSVAEAAFLVAFSFAHELVWASTAAQLRHVLDGNLPDDKPEGSAFERFVQGNPRLARRHARLTDEGSQAADPAGIEAADDIRWWLFHRWLVRTPDHYHVDIVRGALADGLAAAGEGLSADYLPLFADIFDPGRLAALIRGVRFPTHSIGSELPGQLLSTRAVAEATGMEQEVRELLIGVLIIVAWRLAIEPTALPDVIPNHVGISDPLTPAQLLAAIRGASWRPRGRTRVLATETMHQAIDVALQEYVAGVADLLHQVDFLSTRDGSLVALADLPTHAAADDIRPVQLPDGHNAYEGTGFRFRLADERIQELLMGESLYGDKALAIREMYQNALDACRYRAARLAYLQRRGFNVPQWTGRIDFVQGIDESGRHFLECTDRGIGMGYFELKEVFSHAGVGFGDLPEFIEEQALWAEYGIEFWANGQFGIGVLSYFMLADEIMVTTCRMDREGRPGHRLSVNIAGPGTLSRIQDHGPGTDAGTSVRLYLRPDQRETSCVELLSRILWCAEFETSARDGTDELRWPPNTLSSFAPLGELESAEPTVHRHRKHVVDGGNAKVWWSYRAGGILADGLWAGESLFGAVVNLCGAFQPDLTIDRRTMIRFDGGEVARLLREAIPILVRSRVFPDMHDWLKRLMANDPGLADDVASVAIADREVAWSVAGREISIHQVGCFPNDGALFASVRSADEDKTEPIADDLDSFEDAPTPTALDLPEVIASWRLRSWACAGLLDGFNAEVDAPPLVALPTDQALISVGDEDSYSWLRDDRRVPIGHVVAAAVRLRRPPLVVAERLREIGFSVPQQEWPSVVNEDDLLLAARDDFPVSPDRVRVRTLAAGDDEELPVGFVVTAAARLGWSLAAAVTRLEELGFIVPDIPWSGPVTDDDVTMLSRDLRGSAPWLSADSPVPVAHVLAAAYRLGRTPSGIADRLRELGFTAPVRLWPEFITSDDYRLISSGAGKGVRRRAFMSGNLHFATLSQEVSFGDVLAQSFRLGWSPHATAVRLEELGFTVPDEMWPAGVSERDVRLISRDVDGVAPWLQRGEPIDMATIFGVARRLGGPLRPIAERLSELGFAISNEMAIDFSEANGELMRELLDDSVDEFPLNSSGVSVGTILMLSRKLESAPQVVAGLLVEFGFDVPDLEWPDEVSTDDMRLVSSDLDGLAPWARIGERASAVRIVAAAYALGWTPSHTASRLKALGFAVAEQEWPAEVSMTDIRLMGITVEGEGFTFREVGEVTVGSVVSSAYRLGWPPVAVAERLREYGIAVPDRLWPEVVTENDERLLSHDLDGAPGWLVDGARVEAGHVFAAAVRLRTAPAVLALRLTEFGFDVPLRDWPESVTAADVQMIRLREGLSGPFGSAVKGSVWISSDRPVSASHIFTTAHRLDRTVEEVCVRLMRLGYQLPDGVTRVPPGGDEAA